MISIYKADQLNRFLPFSYLNYSVTEFKCYGLLGLLYLFRFHFVLFVNSYVKQEVCALV